MTVDRLSATWLAVLRHLRDEIESARNELERPGLDPVRAEHLRGRIVMARELIALPDRDPAED